jgi:hypothetical protein
MSDGWVEIGKSCQFAIIDTYSVKAWREIELSTNDLNE